MNSLTLRITLKSDVVVTERNASIGGPATLDYIPGATLLGAAAEVLYKGLPSAEAFEIFHGGSVRFGNGVPELGNAPAIPVPFSIHTRKGEHSKTAPCVNLAAVSRDDKTQYEQRREGWLLDPLSPDAGKVQVLSRNRRASMRTSIDKHGKAREGLLFGIQALNAGQTFIARIDAMNDGHLQQIEAALIERPVRLGRSKTAEFGDVWIEKIENSPRPAGSFSNGDRLALFLCVSDLALRDPQTGMVRLLPSAADFGLSDEWRINLSRTFLRTRRYSPFNSHRRRPDSDRQVIAAGSVIAFDQASEGKVAVDQIETTLQAGVGEYRQDGLGEVRLGPMVLRASELNLKEIEAAANAVTTFPSVLADELALWLNHRATKTGQREDAWRTVEKHLDGFRKFKLRNAQWGWLRGLAQVARYSGGNQWLIDQFDQGTRPAESLSDKKAAEAKQEPAAKAGGGRALLWADRYGEHTAREFMLNWMKKWIKEHEHGDLPSQVEMLAARVVRRSGMENGHAK